MQELTWLPNCFIINERFGPFINREGQYELLHPACNSYQRGNLGIFHFFSSLRSAWSSFRGRKVASKASSSIPHEPLPSLPCDDPSSTQDKNDQLKPPDSADVTMEQTLFPICIDEPPSSPLNLVSLFPVASLSRHNAIKNCY